MIISENSCSSGRIIEVEKRYGAIDGLRMIAALGILMMHVEANTDYAINSYLYETVIPSFENFNYLFMTVSAFSMCCGYYEKILLQKISVSEFYEKRIKKFSRFSRYWFCLI